MLGRSFRLGDTLYQIVGVSEKGFTGVETGTMTDIFIPTMMDGRVNRPDYSWIRILVHLKPGVAAGSVRDRMQAPYLEFRTEMAKRRFAGMSQDRIRLFLSETLMLAPAAVGHLTDAARVPAAAGRARCSGGPGASDRVRECGQLNDGPGGGAGPRDGVACFDRRRPAEAGATGVDSERLPRLAGGCHWRRVRLVGCAVHCRPDQSRRTILRGWFFRRTGASLASACS